MKKTYSVPETHIQHLELNSSIMYVVSNTQAEGNKGGWVKGDVTNTASSPNNYSVWDDDWSN